MVERPADARMLRHRAAEAQRLVNDDLMVEFLETYRMEALLKLADLDPTPENAPVIRMLQARAAIAIEFPLAMQAMVVAAPLEDEDDS